MVTSRWGVCPLCKYEADPGGGTLIRGSEIVSTAPVGNCEYLKKPAARHGAQAETLSFVTRSGH